ncbi:hypothetical protein F4677DRAFT_461868 [Hypoxylon crocopeplum]|nr:hypothetical protein F4677DRAFT_461868 [Hypoxylon crocopeplum]
MASLLLHRGDGVASSILSQEHLTGTIVSVVLSFCACSILSCFLGQRVLAVKSWFHLPFIAWGRFSELNHLVADNSTKKSANRKSPSSSVVLGIYTDSWVFVFGTAIIDYGMGLDSNRGVCSVAILLCLFCYVSTKVRLIPLLWSSLPSAVFTIRGGTKRRLESKVYLFNSFGVLTIYGVISTLNFVYRGAYMENGQCIIGIEKTALILLITFIVLINVYLMILFLSPLRSIFSFRGPSRVPAGSPRLRALAMRTFVGALFTTTSSVVNLTVLMMLDGEPGWLYLTCCNADILFSALIVQWVTSRDSASIIDSSPSSESESPDKNISYHATPPPPPPPLRRGQKLVISLPMSATSTSQYEHIFGDAEPDPEPETDVVSATTSRTPVKNTLGSSTSDDNANTTDGLEETIDNDDDDDDDDRIAENGDVNLNINRKERSRPWTDIGTAASSSTSPSTSTSTSTSRAATEIQHRQRQRQQQQRQRQQQSQPPLKREHGRKTPSVSAAVAADLERIRRYRRQRYEASISTFTAPPTPTSSSPTQAAAAPTTPRTTPRRTPTLAYRISELEFEGGERDSRWDDLVGMEGGVGGGSGRGGRGAGEVNWI